MEFLGQVTMEKIEEFVDERQKSWCIHCGRSLTGLDTNEDHVPSKSFAKPRPHHLPVVTICTQCNTSFSLDEQYMVTFLSCVLAGTTDPKGQPNASAARALADSAALRARIEQSRTDYKTVGGETRTLWKPEMDRIKRIVLKNARGHAYFEFGDPRSEALRKIVLSELRNVANCWSDLRRTDGAKVAASVPAVSAFVSSRRPPPEASPYLDVTRPKRPPVTISKASRMSSAACTRSGPIASQNLPSTFRRRVSSTSVYASCRTRYASVSACASCQSFGSMRSAARSRFRRSKLANALARRRASMSGNGGKAIRSSISWH